MLWGSEHAFPINEHKVMLQDTQRLEAYSSAMKNSVKEKVIIDVGAGTAVLSLNALQWGAATVFGLEKDFSTHNFT